MIVLVVSLPFVVRRGRAALARRRFRPAGHGLLHPRVFSPLATRLLRPFGGGAIEPLPWGAGIGVLLFYGFTWVVGGAALTCLLAAVGAHPGWPRSRSWAGPARSGRSWPW